MRYQSLVTAAVLAAAVGIAACGSGGNSAGGTIQSGQGQGGSAPYRVLVSSGLSAPAYQAISDTEVLSAKAGARNINAQGGIDGHQVVLTVVDDGANPTTAVTALLNAIHSGDKPDLYLTSGPSPVSNAVLPILKANHILSFNLAPTGGSSNPAMFPLNFDEASVSAGTALAFIPVMKAAGYHKVGIIHGNDPYGATFGTAMNSDLTAAGFTVSANQPYDVSALNMTPELQAVEATKPDVLVMDGYGPPVGYLLKDMQLLGWSIPILGDGSVGSTAVNYTPPPAGYLGTPLIKNLKVEVYKSTVYTPADTVVNTAVKTMTSLGKIDGPLLTAWNYDAFPLVAAAAKAAHSIDARAIAQALASPSVQARAHTAMLSLYRFTAASHAPNPAASEFTFISPSRIVNGQFQREQGQ